MEKIMENSSNSDLNSINQAESSLDKIIQTSSQNVKDEVELKIAKKRGRKPKSETDKKLVSPNMSNAHPELIKFNREQYAQGLKTVFALSGMYLAKATKFDGFNMSKEELEAISDQGSVVCEQFMPAIDPKYIALGGFVMVSGGIYLTKVAAYKEYVAIQKAKQVQGDIKKD